MLEQTTENNLGTYHRRAIGNVSASPLAMLILVVRWSASSLPLSAIKNCRPAKISLAKCTWSDCTAMNYVAFCAFIMSGPFCSRVIWNSPLWVIFRGVATAVSVVSKIWGHHWMVINQFIHLGYTVVGQKVSLTHFDIAPIYATPLVIFNMSSTKPYTPRPPLNLTCSFSEVES